jgi:putative peptidoglycan lipid II flippase
MLAFVAIRGRNTPPAIATLTWGQKTLLAAGTTFGVLAMTVALWPALRRIGFRWKLRWDWGHESVRHLGVLAKWVIVYVAANQLAYFLIINLNGRVGTGAYTVYSQAFIFFSLPTRSAVSTSRRCSRVSPSDGAAAIGTAFASSSRAGSATR